MTTMTTTTTRHIHGSLKNIMVGAATDPADVAQRERRLSCQLQLMRSTGSSMSFRHSLQEWHNGDPTAPPATMETTTPDESGQSLPGINLMAKRILIAVNFFVETNRLEPYTAVYLINIMNWNEVNFGVVSLVMNMVMLVFQAPAGDLLDKTKEWKKVITMLAIILASITTVMVVWTTNFWAILAGKTIEGISATIFLPALMSLLLGICRTEADVPSFITTTEVSNKIGSFVFVCACAAISYFAYPNIESMFYLLGAGGLTAAFLTMAIPESQIDHDKARQLDEVDSHSGEDANIKDGKQEDSANKKATPSHYRDLLQNRTILLFAMITFSYHLANACVLPLLAQYVASISLEETQLALTSAILMVVYFSQTVTSFLMSYAIDRFDHKRVMIVAFVALPIRCMLVALAIVYYNNEWVLIAMQVFDGIGAGVYDIMLPITVKKLSQGSGHFGFMFGFIITMWRMGHGFSLLMGEALVHLFGYVTAFVVIGAIGVFNLIFFVLFFNLEGDSVQA